MPAPATTPETVTLTPHELADLLGLPRADAGLLSGAAVRLPAAWVAGWQARTGPLELTFADVELLTGRPERTLRAWAAKGLLRCRRVSAGGGPKGNSARVAPAALVECLRTLNGGAAPVVIETPSQRQRRGADARRRAMEACAGGRPGKGIGAAKARTA